MPTRATRSCAPLVLLAAALLAAIGCRETPEPEGTRETRDKQAAASLSRGSRTRAATRLFVAPWGTGPTSLGRVVPEEGNPEGPMSFVVGGDGTLFVLDQVNARIQVLSPSGEARGAIPLPGDSFQDLELDGQGGFVVLDRLSAASLAFVDAHGQVKREVPLVGPGIREGAAVTAIFRAEDGVWAEVEHASLVRLTDAQGNPDGARATRQGRFAPGGGALRASLVRPSGVEISHLPTSGPAARRVLAFAHPLSAITSMHVEPTGRIALSAIEYEERPEPPYDILAAHHTLVVLSPQGHEEARVPLPVQRGPEQTFRPVRSGDDGATYALTCTDAGAEIWKVTP